MELIHPSNNGGNAPAATAEGPPQPLSPASPTPPFPRSPPASPATHDAPALPTAAAAAAPPPPPPAVIDSEAAVMALIDGSGLELACRVPLRDMQRACVKVPLLSTMLSGARRYKLYLQLLLDHGAALVDLPPPGAAAASAESTSSTATATTAAAAARVAALFPAGHFTSPDEVEAAVAHLAAAAGLSLGPEQSGVLLAIAAVVSAGALPTGRESLRMLFNLMLVVARDFMAPSAAYLYDGATSMLFRLLLQYQDPALSAHLDQPGVCVGALLLTLTRGLFVRREEDYTAAYGVLDWVFVLGDPVLVPYVALALVLAHRQRLLATPATGLQATLDALCVALPNDRSKAIDPRLVDGRSIALVPVWSGKSLCQNADLVLRNTPLSAQRVLEFCVYPESGSINKTPRALEEYYAAAACLPLERADIATSFSTRQQAGDGTTPTATSAPISPQPLQYIVVDCRSKGSFEYARLPTAVLVGDVLGYDAGKLAELVARLAPSKGRHLSLFGTGRALVEEVNLLKLVALQLMRAGFPFVSITTGGFRCVIPLIRSNAIRVILNSGAEDGEPHSLLAGLPHRITELRDAYLPAAESAEAVKARAAELSVKAKEGLSTASNWGWGLYERAQERFSSAKEAAREAIAASLITDEEALRQARAESGGRGRGGGTRPANPPATSAPAPAPAAPLQGRVATATPTTTTTAGPAPPPQQMFSLGGEDGEEDDDDFGLITAVPTRPLKGAVVVDAADDDHHDSGTTPAAAAQSAPASGANGAAPHPANAPHEAEAAVNIAGSIDKEFEDLFGS